MRRRDFIPAIGLGASYFAAGAGGLGAAKGQAKVGSVSWNFHTLAPGGHPEQAIDIIGSLGFDGIELIANSRQDVDQYWTDATIDRIRKQVERNHLVVNQFPFFQPVVAGLTSRDAE